MPAHLRYKTASGNLDTLPLLVNSGGVLLCVPVAGSLQLLCRITTKDGVWRIEDLGGGVRRKGVLIQDRESPLVHKEELTIGELQVQFIESPELDPRPPLEVLFRENGELRAELVKRREEISSLKLSLSRAEKSVADEQERIRKAISINEDLKLELSRKDSTIGQGAEALKVCQAQVGELSQQMLRAQKRLQEMEEKLRQAERDIEGGRKREQGLVEQRDQLLAANTALLSENTDLRAVIDGRTKPPTR